MTLSKDVDPIVYGQPWPELTYEGKWKASMQYIAVLVRGFREVLSNRFDGETANHVAEAVWKGIFVSYMDAMEDSLGVKGRKDAVAAIKWCAYADEEICGFKATCLEATENQAERAVISCQLGDSLEKEDCAAMLNGMTQCIEARFPGYEFKVDSMYHDTHVCRYRVVRKAT